MRQSIEFSLAGRGYPQSQQGDPWVGWQERTAHPSAASGGGGPGKFRNAKPMNSPDQPGHSAPYSPVGAKQGSSVGLGGPDPFAESDAVPLQQSAPKPPPGTVARTEEVTVEETDQAKIDIKFRVRADNTSSKLHPKAAKTSFARNAVVATFPTVAFDAAGVVTAITSKFLLRGTIPIRTSYGTQASASDLSCYGRGTTASDRQNGDITLGFHESRHQADFIAYLQSHDFPTFSIEVGDTQTQYNQAKTAFKADLAAYYEAMEADSESRTDQVGYTLDEFERSGGECYAHS